MTERIMQRGAADEPAGEPENDVERRPRRAVARRDGTEPARRPRQAGADAEQRKGEARGPASDEIRQARRRAMRKRQQQKEQTFSVVAAGPTSVAAASEILPAQPIALPPSVTDADGQYTYRSLVRHSFLVLVLVPFVAVSLFYLFIAADQYGSVSRLTIRGTASAPSADLGSLIGGLGSSLTPEVIDSHVLVEYVHSPEVIQHLIDNADFLRIYTRPEADFWYRLDPNAPMEDLIDYWEMMSTIEFDPDTQISELVVRAFRPDDAQRLADAVLTLSEKLVNDLSQRAREDALRTARQEVDRAEDRFRASRAAMALYRDTEREINPVATAEAQQQILGALEADLARQKALLTGLLTTMSSQSPRVVYVETQIKALEQQIKNQRRDLAEASDSVSGEPVLTKRLSRYEELVAEQQFADIALQSSRESLEAARVDADRQNRYLSVFVHPSLPQDSQYPEALRWTAIVSVAGFLLWGVFSLLSSIVRDHVR